MDDGRESAQICATAVGCLRSVSACEFASSLRKVSRLTPREMDVFLLLPGGPSNRDLAGALHITERTVKAHLASIVDKLELGSRMEACLVAWAYGTNDCPEGQ